MILPCWMVFFITQSGITRTEPLACYDKALDRAKKGPSGSRFQISRFHDEPEADHIILEGYVPQYIRVSGDWQSPLCQSRHSFISLFASLRCHSQIGITSEHSEMKEGKIHPCGMCRKKGKRKERSDEALCHHTYCSQRNLLDSTVCGIGKVTEDSP